MATDPQRATEALAVIKGEHDAERLLAAIQHDTAPADALFEAMGLVAATCDGDRIRGFARKLQKQLEIATAR